MITRINDAIALRATLILGSAWCAYAFLVLCLLPLLFPAQENTILYVSNCCQLVALPILALGTSILGRSAETRAQQDHEAIMAELQEIKEIHVTVQGLHCIKAIAIVNQPEGESHG